jgi:hypothetical protein
MTLDNLLRIGRLKPHVADKAEIERLLAAAERALQDAGVQGLSTDSRLDLTYRAIMQAALIAMLANNLRPATSEPAAISFLSRRCLRPSASRPTAFPCLKVFEQRET